MVILSDDFSPSGASELTMYDPDDPDADDDIPGMSFGSTCLWRDDAERVSSSVLSFLSQQAKELRSRWSTHSD